MEAILKELKSNKVANRTEIAKKVGLSLDGFNKWVQSEKKDIERLKIILDLAGYEMVICKKVSL